MNIQNTTEPENTKHKVKQGAEVWGPKDRKLCCAAFGKFIRLADKAPFWGEIKASVEVIAKELRK